MADVFSSSPLSRIVAQTLRVAFGCSFHQAFAIISRSLLSVCQTFTVHRGSLCVLYLFTGERFFFHQASALARTLRVLPLVNTQFVDVNPLFYFSARSTHFAKLLQRGTYFIIPSVNGSTQRVFSFMHGSTKHACREPCVLMRVCTLTQHSKQCVVDCLNCLHALGASLAFLSSVSQSTEFILQFSCCIAAFHALSAGL